MKKISLILKLSFKFSNKYAFDYFKSIIKYILMGIIGFVFIPLTSVNPFFAILAIFITIPVFCYCFWKGYVVTYALNYAALDFISKAPSKTFESYIQQAFKHEKKLVGFVSFMALIILIGYIPTVAYFISSIPYEQMIIDPYNTVVDTKPIIIFSIINTFILAQFMNFALQAFFFKEKENYFTLLINCYKDTGFEGFILSNMIIGLVNLLFFAGPVIYLIIFLPLNLIIYSLNVFFYVSKIKRKQN